MQNVIVMALVLTIVTLQIVHLVKKKKTTGSCTGCSCAGNCPGSCAKNCADITQN